MPTKAIWMGSYLPATLRTITEETDQKVTEQMEALKSLKELLDAGILTQEEFNVKKRQILGL